MSSRYLDFEQFFDQSIDLVGVLTTEGNLQWMNRQWTARLGWSMEELRSKPVADFLHTEDIKDSYAVFCKVSEDAENIADFTSRIVCSDGKYVWVKWNLHAMENGMVGVVGRDITNRIETQKSIAHRKRFLELAARIANMGYWRFDLRTYTHSWSDTTLRIPRPDT